MRAAQRPSWWFVLICYKFISKDLLNRLKKSGVDSVDSVDSFRCHWIILDPIIWASLSWKPYEALHRVGLIGFYRRHVTNEYTWVRKQFCTPPTSTYWWMTTWWMMNAYERIWTLRLYISRWTLAEVLRPIIYQKHLPDPFNCCFCLNLLGSRSAGCALVFRRLDCSGCAQFLQFCALNLPGWSCLTWQEIDIWIIYGLYKSMLYNDFKRLLNKFEYQLGLGQRQTQMIQILHHILVVLHGLTKA